jgi:tetratricopeptide (TPR) repeat protein
MDVVNPKEMATNNLQQEKGNFLWFKLFVKVLLSMKHNKGAHRDLVEILPTNDLQSYFVADFAKNYTRDKVIEWFTRDDSCLLKELNKASRQQHLDRLFKFGCLIQDIYEQLKTEHDKQAKDNEKVTTLYRSQVISEFELEQLLKANTGELIAINSFMSTWDDRMKAIDCLQKQNLPDGFKSVLFEIEVDYRKKSNLFARISATEDITLFMLGCIFRIRSIAEDNLSNCYVLKLELCSDDDDDFKSIFDYMTKNFIQPEADLITLGSLLYKMGEIDKAQQCFKLILNDLDTTDPNYAHCYDGLGYIANDQGRLDEALELHEQGLNLRMNHGKFYPNDSLIALSHIHLANDYKDKGDYDTALLHVKKARTLIRKQNLQEDQLNVAACHMIEGSILYERGKGIEALVQFQQALDVYKQQGMPDDHPDLAAVYQDMGLCHLNPRTEIHNPTLALDYCVQGLKIRQKALPINHRSTGISYKSIGVAYEQLKEYQYALEFYQKANSIHHILNKTCRELHTTEGDIKRIQK